MSLSESLRSIYEKANYDIIFGKTKSDNRITLSVNGIVSGNVRLLFGQPVAIITAYNPSIDFEKPNIVSDTENKSAHTRLEEYLKRKGIEHYNAVGYSKGLAYSEPSFALFRVSREQSAAIGRRFGQAAIFYFENSKGEIIDCGEDTFSLIRQLPLVELHIHTEGAIPLPHLLKMAKSSKNQNTDFIETEDDLSNFLRYKNFHEFIKKWVWMISLIESEVDYSDIVYSVMKSLRATGVNHAELHFSPFDHLDRLNPTAITEAAIDGIRRSTQDLNMTGALIVDLVRNHPVETARSRIDSISHLVGDQLVGLGLGGSESKFAAELFADSFQYARSKGFRTVAHAGETAGAESVRSTLVDLKAERIGHGIRALDDASLVEQLVKLQTPLEVCITSNQATGVIDDIENHPVRKMIDLGLNLSLNSDDPTMFRTNLQQEFDLFVSDFSATRVEIKQLIKNSIDSSFASESRKQELHQLLTAK
ncbi:MAG: adenosine deaminase [Leptonema sp. (in: Bacteria)]|nr:adenosine deaminase [Leptonema sp. (in: bacteria)]